MGIGQRGPTGSLATERGRAKTASGAPACFLSGISGWFSLSLGAWGLGAEESGAAKDGFGGAVADLGLLISGPRVTHCPHPYARARALMARQWSARCYGVARQRDGSRQNSIGGSGVLSLRHFGLVLFIPWRLGAGCRRIWRGEKWFRPARCCSTGSGRLDLDLDLLISGPRVSLLHQPHACARALMARPWSARCYGVARQREGSRQNSLGGSGVLSLRHFGLVLFIP